MLEKTYNERFSKQSIMNAIDKMPNLSFEKKSEIKNNLSKSDECNKLLNKIKKLNTLPLEFFVKEYIRTYGHGQFVKPILQAEDKKRTILGGIGWAKMKKFINSESGAIKEEFKVWRYIKPEGINGMLKEAGSNIQIKVNYYGPETKSEWFESCKTLLKPGTIFRHKKEQYCSTTLKKWNLDNLAKQKWK